MALGIEEAAESQGARFAAGWQPFNDPACERGEDLLIFVEQVIGSGRIVAVVDQGILDQDSLAPACTFQLPHFYMRVARIASVEKGAALMFRIQPGIVRICLPDRNVPTMLPIADTA